MFEQIDDCIQHYYATLEPGVYIMTISVYGGYSYAYLNKANNEHGNYQRASYWDAAPTYAYCRNGIWAVCGQYITNADLGNPYKTALLVWGDYSSGTYTLRESIISRGTSIVAGANGRLRGTWASPSINDTMSIVIPGGIINVKILTATQVQITGTTSDYTVRAISAI